MIVENPEDSLMFHLISLDIPFVLLLRSPYENIKVLAVTKLIDSRQPNCYHNEKMSSQNTFFLRSF